MFVTETLLIKIQGDQRLIKFAKKLDVDDIDIDLIDTINPFQEAFEILSKKLTHSSKYYSGDNL